MTRAASDWWTTFFDGAARETWRWARGREENRAEARAIERVLELTARSAVLDVPCGEGRLALELATFGHRLVGLDASTDSLTEARASAAQRGLELEFVQGDMRALPWRERFDAAFCSGSSFGLFDDDGNRAFLASLARAVRPGGRFLLEYPLVRELVDAHPLGRDWRILGERLLLTESHIDERAGRLEALHVFVDLARPSSLEERFASYRVYALAEVVRLFEDAGLGRPTQLGGLDGRPFVSGSEELYLVATRA